MMRTSDINIDFTNEEEDFYSRPRQPFHKFRYPTGYRNCIWNSKPVRVDKSKQVLDLLRYIMNQCQLDTSSVDWSIVERELRKIV